MTTPKILKTLEIAFLGHLSQTLDPFIEQLIKQLDRSLDWRNNLIHNRLQIVRQPRRVHLQIVNKIPCLSICMVDPHKVR